MSGWGATIKIIIILVKVHLDTFIFLSANEELSFVV